MLAGRAQAGAVFAQVVEVGARTSCALVRARIDAVEAGLAVETTVDRIGKVLGASELARVEHLQPPAARGRHRLHPRRRLGRHRRRLRVIHGRALPRHRCATAASVRLSTPPESATPTSPSSAMSPMNSSRASSSPSKAGAGSFSMFGLLSQRCRLAVAAQIFATARARRLRASRRSRPWRSAHHRPPRELDAHSGAVGIVDGSLVARRARCARASDGARPSSWSRRSRRRRLHRAVAAARAPALARPSGPSCRTRGLCTTSSTPSQARRRSSPSARSSGGLVVDFEGQQRDFVRRRRLRSCRRPARAAHWRVPAACASRSPDPRREPSRARSDAGRRNRDGAGSRRRSA